MGLLAHKLTLPDQTVLDASSIRSVTLTQQVSDQTDLSPGAACAACASIQLWVPSGGPAISAGTELVLSCVDSQTGTETRLGIFRAEKPEKISAHVMQITAYDRMTLLDQDLSDWLRQQQTAFPMTLADLAGAVCARCGVVPATGTLAALPNRDYSVSAFFADGITGRQLIQWIGQAAGRFARMTPEGELEFAWYTEYAASGVAPGSSRVWTALNLSGQIFCAGDQVWTFPQPRSGYLSGALTCRDEPVAPVDRVVIRQSDTDAGVGYPEDAAGNTLILQGNLLLTAGSADTLLPVARTILEQMQGLAYTPLTVRMQQTDPLPEPGRIVTVTDSTGRTVRTCVMKRTLSGQQVTLESTGNPRRDSAGAVNTRKWENLQGRLLEIRANVDGLNITARDLQGQYTRLEQTVDSFSLTAVEDGTTSRLVLSANGVELTSASIQFSGMVRFSDLSTPGQTVISGSNLTAGRIQDRTGEKFVIDLDSGSFNAFGKFTCGNDDTGYATLEAGVLTIYGDTTSDSPGVRVYRGTASGGNLDLYNYTNHERTISFEGGTGYGYFRAIKIWDSAGGERTLYCDGDGTVKWR